ncbi:MAG: hypothetical protein Q4A31_10160 [Corynebacterium sp.]|uniref:hypothetical protein n=1 Tax=Corynebacterium sp. TaxID=1720 RepID=UPI0026DAE4E5|nr:hypothetical protein [Corynebacterium sp.]MDO4762271.1 hypothetical protein [Corynebacterium sp.]
MKLPLGRPLGVGIAVAMAAGAILINGNYLDVFEPHRDVNPEASKVVVISVRSNSFEQVVLGELYKQGLERSGRQATLSLDRVGTEQGTDRLPYGSADLVISCAGDMLYRMNTARAKELRLEIKANDYDRDESREKVYEAVMQSLSDNVNATDPSNAIGCAHSKSGLPEHIVPVYRVPVLDRKERGTLNVVSGSITTKDLGDLVKRAKEIGSASDAVREFLNEKGIAFK